MEKMLIMNLCGKEIIERNTTSDTVSILVDSKNCLCQHDFFHPIISRKGKCISEKMQINIEKHSTELT